jgi:hypothetical protein
MSFGLYSGGAGDSLLRAAIAKLDFGGKVMAAV